LKVSHFGLAIVILFLLNTFTSVPFIKEEVAPSYQQLLDAATYIVNRYDGRIGLVSESEDTGSNVPDGTPCYRTFWVYSDNLWASEALEPFYPQIAENISKSITPYIAEYGNSQLFEVVLGKKIPAPIHDGRDLKVATYTFNDTNYTVWVDRHRPEDGGIFYDAEEYADLAFYLSLNYYLDHNTIASERWFRTGEMMWNYTTNNGFYDKAARKDGRYQNYKLGLYLFAVKVTGFASAIYESVENAAWSYQKENGGIAAQSYLNGTIYGTANVETTSALLLAYNEELISKFAHVRVGAYYYIWWGIPFNNHWNEGIKNTPFLGKYNSSDPTIADQHILLAKQHKIDFFAVSWVGKGTWVDWMDTPDGTWDFDEIDYNLKNGLLNASHIQNFNFCLFYETKLILENTIMHDKNFTEIFINDMVYAAENYFDNPSYLRVDGKPVLFIYNLPYLYEKLSISEVQRLLNVTRQLLANIDFNIYLVGDCGGGPSPPCADSPLLHSMNAVTSYFFSDPSKGWEKILEDAENYYPEWRRVADSKGIKFIPNTYPGFDNTEHCEWKQSQNMSCTPIVLPPNEIMFKKILTTAVNCADNELKIVMITSWNEWLESTAIEPSMEFGELFLHTIYDVIPEFPSFIILPLYMIATLLVIIIYRRKRRAIII